MDLVLYNMPKLETLELELEGNLNIYSSSSPPPKRTQNPTYNSLIKGIIESGESGRQLRGLLQ